MFHWGEILAYLGVFAALVAAGFGMPIPEELPIVGAGALVGHSASAPRVPPEATGVLAAAPQAGFPAGVPWAALVKAHEHQPPLRIRWWIMLPVCILGVVISDGFLYGIGRIWGVHVLDFAWIRRFLLADGIYAIPGVSLLFFLAYWFTDHFVELVKKVDSVRPILVVAVIAAVAGYFAYHFLNRPVMTGDPKELPIIGEQVAAHLGKSGVHDAAAVREQLRAQEEKQAPPAGLA